MFCFFFYVLLYFSPAAGFTTFSAYYAVASMREERRADISQSRRKIHQRERNAKPEASAHNMVRVIFYSE
jgi:hypothetical protein